MIYIILKIYTICNAVSVDGLLIAVKVFSLCGKTKTKISDMLTACTSYLLLPDAVVRRQQPSLYHEVIFDKTESLCTWLFPFLCPFWDRTMIGGGELEPRRKVGTESSGAGIGGNEMRWGLEDGIKSEYEEREADGMSI